jgi:hypothetical protein
MDCLGKQFPYCLAEQESQAQATCSLIWAVAGQCGMRTHITPLGTCLLYFSVPQFAS